MNLTPELKAEILEKNQKLENLKPILKTEFLGIDEVIDQVIESIRPFYIFPKSLRRPLVVNLWGMTGTGKTSLVNRIVELLELRHKYCKFDVGEYAHSSSDWKLKFDLSDKVQKMQDRHLVVVFDEFQLGRTIDEAGGEVDRSSLRPIWDIIDSGIISQMSKSNFSCYELIQKLKKCLAHGVQVEDGVVIANEEFYGAMFQNHYIRPVDFEINKQRKKRKKEDSDEEETVIEDMTLEPDEDELEDYDYDEIGSYKYIANNPFNRKMHKRPYFIKYDHYRTLFEANPSYFNDLDDYEQWKDRFRQHDGDTIVNMLYRDFVVSAPLMQQEDYSQSLVFCIGNIDEAYAMTHSSNPDADADLFYEHSRKITTPKMKDALSLRFRMEQIGRLGNNHIVYPSFNKDTYRKIIEKCLNQRVKYFADAFGIALTFDPSVHDIIFKEGVFPTQGARPVMSTMNTLIDSYIAKLISEVILQNPTADTITWRFEDNEPRYIVQAKGPDETTEYIYPVKLNLENLRKSDFSETQAKVAVHEAGHAVIAIMKAKLVPQEVKSRTASVAEGTCFINLPEVSTKFSLYNDILISLGGLEAEKLVFGDDMMGAGAGSDLARATGLAAAMVKTYGMHTNLHQISTQMAGPNAIYDPESNKEAEKSAIEIVEKAQQEVKECLEQNKQFLLELGYHLSVYPNILEADLKKMARRYTKEFRSRDSYYDFKNTIKSELRKFGRLPATKQGPKPKLDVVQQQLAAHE